MRAQDLLSTFLYGVPELENPKVCSWFDDDLMAGGVGAASGYVAPSAINFDRSSSQELTRTFGTPTSLTAWTFRVRIRKTMLGATAGNQMGIFSCNTTSNPWGFLAFNAGSNDKIYAQPYYGGDTASAAEFRDPSAFLDLVWVWDSLNGTAADRQRFYVNNVRLTGFSSFPSISLGASSHINAAVAHVIGDYLGYTRHFDGVMEDIAFIDGLALDPDAFGEYDADGNWVSKAYSYVPDAVVIAQSEGTAIGNLTLNNGIAAAFDGSFSTVAVGESSNPLYIGKSWGTGNAKTVTKAVVYGASATPPAGVTVTLQGSNDGSAWTNIGSITKSAGTVETITATDTTTAYLYHRVAYATATQTNIYQVYFYEVNADTNPFFGNNGFLLQDATGTDQSGNGNNWTPVNSPTTVYDVSTPSASDDVGTFCRLSELDKRSDVTLQSAATKITSISSSGGVRGTMFVAGSGQYYWEVVAASNAVRVGIATGQVTLSSLAAGIAGSVEYNGLAGSIMVDGSTVQSGLATFTTSDIIGCFLNLDAGTVAFKKNNVAVGTAVSIDAADYWTLWLVRTAASSHAFEIVMDSRDWIYAPGGSYVAMHTGNLPEPTSLADQFLQIGESGTTIEASLAAMIAAKGWVKYLTIFKRNSSTQESWKTRLSWQPGYEAYIDTNAGLVAQTSLAADAYWGQAWCLDAPYGYAATVSHAQTVTTTVTHNLGCGTRCMIVVKATGTGNWWQFHPSLPSGKLYQLDTGVAGTTSSVITNVQTNSFDIDASIGTGNYEVIVIAESDCFFLTGYTGSGVADGTMIYANGGVQMGCVKHSTDGTSRHLVYSRITNPYNPNSFVLNYQGTESTTGLTSYRMDLLSTGMKSRNADLYQDSGGAWFTAWGFAHPLKYALGQ